MIKFSGVGDTPSTAILLKDYLATDKNRADLLREYLVPLSATTGTPFAKTSCFIPLYYPQQGNLKKAELVSASKDILAECDTLGLETLIVCDGKYFEYLTGVKGLERQIGNAFNCIHLGYEHITILPALSYKAIEMAPEKRSLQTKAFLTIANVLNKTYEETAEFKFDHYEVLQHPRELTKLLEYEELAIDIETSGLRFESDELVSISFSWSDKSAVVLPIHRKLQDANGELREAKWKDAIKKFFESYNGKKIFHNALFDVKFLVRHLFMETSLDNIGRTYGVSCMTKGSSKANKSINMLEDTMIMAFLCFNSTSRTSLSLKELTYDYLGDYAVNVKDVLSLNKDELLYYNAKDTAGTYHLWDKYKKLIIEEDQLSVYQDIFQPSLHYLLNMMLAGLPMSKSKVTAATVEVQNMYDTAVKTLQSNNYVRLAVKQLQMDAADKYNAKTKIKRKTALDFQDLVFNPNSSTQLCVLLFDIMEYEVKETTDKGKPKTSRSVLEEMLEEEPLAERKAVLEALMEVSKTGIVISTFLKVFAELWFDVGTGDIGRLYGNQRLGGTISGRLSSNSPNFANLPSKGPMGKLIKGCFVAPEGYLFAASDYAALEDRVGSCITKDKNKIKEFQEKFDGHSLRAYAFFKEEIEEKLGESLDLNDPASINRIKTECPEIRDKSKSPSFGMAYGSGPGKVQALLKCSRAKAESVYNSYHTLYYGTAQFAKQSIAEAKRDGFTTGAFGLKLRTPRINSRNETIAGQEGRSLNNMKIQSYGLLMNRAGILFQERIEAAGYANEVILINQIHDALYLLVKDDAEIVKWVNENLIEVMNLPYLDDEPVHNESELDIGRTWKDQVTIKNDTTLEEIKEVLSNL